MPDENSNLPAVIPAVNDVGRIIGIAAPLVSGIVTIGFLSILAIWLFHPPQPNDQVLALLVGTTAAAFTQVVNYWLGSSNGSAMKDNTISRIAAATPAVVAQTVTDKVVADVKSAANGTK